MQALASLIEEHRLISRLVAALEVYVLRLEQHAAVPDADLGLFARAFSEFADEIHHDKEENILLPLLSRHGFNWDWGVLPMVRREHRQERYLVDVLSQAAERAGTWSEEDRRHIAAVARALIEFERNHHRTENTQLFPEVAARLDPAARTQLARELERFDAHPSQKQRRAEAVGLLCQLVERYVADCPPRSRQAAAPVTR